MTLSACLYVQIHTSSELKRCDERAAQQHMQMDAALLSHLSGMPVDFDVPRRKALELE